MSPRKDTFAPGAEVIAFAVKHDDRVIASREAINMVLTIDRHRSHLLEFPSVGQFAPALDNLITKLTTANGYSHTSLLRRRPQIAADRFLI
jgi:hypothetical protein